MGAPRVARVVEQFSGGANRLVELIALVGPRAAASCCPSGTTVPGRYESFGL